MQDAYCQLRASLVSLYRRFAGDSEEVQREWLAFLQRADTQLLDALTACIRRSLHEVARVLQGEHKAAEVPPLFVLNVVLDTNGRQVPQHATAFSRAGLRCCSWACHVFRPSACLPVSGWS